MKEPEKTENKNNKNELLKRFLLSALVKYSKESLVNDQKKINEQFQVNELIEKLMEDNAAKQKAIDRRKLF